MIRYISTRGGGKPQSFEDVLLSGLAPDGGLYVPQTLPQIDISSLKGKNYIEIAEIIMFPFVEESISLGDFRAILTETYSDTVFKNKEITPLVHLGAYGNGNIHVMEQFHGPTIAFKDVALQLLGRLFDHVLTKRGENVTIVGATSGDTGSAAIEGCRHSSHVNIFILHPKGRVSDVQRKQMTTVVAPNVHNIAVDGSFDDCQNMVKAMFNDKKFREEMNLSAVNSINWARIMAQIVYYFVTAVQLGVPEEKISFVVPTGNFGNVLAAYYARHMGLPIETLMISSNKNDILTRFFETGEMKIGESYATLSPSMDIQISSNFERYLYDLLGRDADRLAVLMAEFVQNGDITLSDKQHQSSCEEFAFSRADDEQTLEAIRECYEQTTYILDPHTAVGMVGAKALSGKTEGTVVLLATAHPAKFPDAVEKAIGIRPDLPPHLSDLFDREEIITECGNDLNEIQTFIRQSSKN